MNLYWKYICYKLVGITLIIGFVLSSLPISAANSDLSDQNIAVDEKMDSLLIAVQELMEIDSTYEMIKQESLILSLLIEDSNDFYSLTKNLFLLDYKLERKGDGVSRSIVRYWLGYYMKSQKLMDNALELWNGIENTIPDFLKAELYLNKGEVLSTIGDYDNAILQLEVLKNLANVNDSISWAAKMMEADVYDSQQLYLKEINEWLKCLDWLDDKNQLWWNVIAFKRLADAYRNIEDYDSAIIYLNKANDFHRSYDSDSPDLYQYYVDIALIFELQGNTSKALGYLKTASKEMRKANNALSEAEISYRIAYIYYDISKYDQAKEYNDKALRISNANDFDELLLRVYFLAYKIDQKQNKFEEALKEYANYSELKLRFNNEEKESIRDTYLKQYQIERAEKQYKLIIASEELKDFELEQFKLQSEKTDAELNLLKEQQASKEIELYNQILVANETKNQLELVRKKNEAIQQSREIERLESERQLSKLQLEEQKSKELANQRKIENLTQENKNKELMLEIESQKINRVRWFSGFSIVIVILLIVFLTTKIKANKILFSKNQEIAYQHREIELKNKKLAVEKGKTDSLLLNILPNETAEELKSSGKVLPKVYESVSVLFSDFSGFTKLTEKMDPVEVLKNLEFMFSNFDEIATANEMERIKTIGDGYMCAGGLPIQNETHPLNAVKSGLAFIEALKSFNKEQKKLNKPEWILRIGINTGKVVAGVIGKRKFAYDIWGDTVNLASRAESHGLPNKVNITENTYQEIKHAYECEYRGEVEVKNIGKVKMYIVLSEKN